PPVNREDRPAREPVSQAGPRPLDIVIQAEVDALVTRRNAAFPRPGNPRTAAEVKQELVGLALSGGGIRSAMFNLGLLQALYTNGLLRYVDYLSTVSGGSYVGAYFSSLMLQLREIYLPTPEETGDTAAYPILTPFQVLRDEVKMKDR